MMLSRLFCPLIGSKSTVSLRLLSWIQPVLQRMMSIKDNSMYYPKKRPVAFSQEQTISS